MANKEREGVILDDLTRVEQMKYEYEKELEYLNNVIFNLIKENKALKAAKRKKRMLNNILSQTF